MALLVCLIPTTIGALLSAIGIAGMDRLVRANVLAMSGRAVEAAGDVDTLLLDKTGTITLGNRQATEFLPLPGIEFEELRDAARCASLADQTPEGRSVVELALGSGRRTSDLPGRAEFVTFSAQTRMSGVDLPSRRRSARAPDRRCAVAGRRRRRSWTHGRRDRRGGRNAAGGGRAIIHRHPGRAPETAARCSG